jgi:hypothetical protein
MAEVFLGNQVSEFGLKVQHVREDFPTLRHQGRMPTHGLKTLILIKILYHLKIMVQKVGDHTSSKKNK